MSCMDAGALLTLFTDAPSIPAMCSSAPCASLPVIRRRLRRCAEGDGGGAVRLTFATGPATAARATSRFCDQEYLTGVARKPLLCLEACGFSRARDGTVSRRYPQSRHR